MLNNSRFSNGIFILCILFAAWAILFARPTKPSQSPPTRSDGKTIVIPQNLVVANKIYWMKNGEEGFTPWWAVWIDKNDHAFINMDNDVHSVKSDFEIKIRRVEDAFEVTVYDKDMRFHRYGDSIGSPYQTSAMPISRLVVALNGDQKQQIVDRDEIEVERR